MEQLELDLNISPSIEVLSFTPRQIGILNERGIKTIGTGKYPHAMDLSR